MHFNQNKKNRCPAPHLSTGYYTYEKKLYALTKINIVRLFSKSDAKNHE